LARVRPRGDVLDALTVDHRRAGEKPGDHPWQEPVLDRPDPLVQRGLVVFAGDCDGLLRHDRPAVQRGIDDVDRAAGDARAVVQGVADGVAARERRQQ